MSMRRTLPIAITMIAGFIVLINSYIIWPDLNAFVVKYVNRTSSLSVAWAVGIGALNLVRVHQGRITRKSSNWQYSVLLMIAFVFFVVFGLLIKQNHSHPVFLFIFNSIQPPLSSTMFALLCFYISSAAFRAFRMRSMETTLMLLSAFVIMMGNVSIGSAIWAGFPDLSDWIMSTINTASLRAITMGVTLGAVSQSIRNLLGIERGHLAE